MIKGLNEAPRFRENTFTIVWGKRLAEENTKLLDWGIGRDQIGAGSPVSSSGVVEAASVM